MAQGADEGQRQSVYTRLCVFACLLASPGPGYVCVQPALTGLGRSGALLGGPL